MDLSHFQSDDKPETPQPNDKVFFNLNRGPLKGGQAGGRAGELLVEGAASRQQPTRHCSHLIQITAPGIDS